MLIIEETQFLSELAELKASKSQELSDSPVIADAVVLENNTYDSFRKQPGEKNIPVEVKSIVASLSHEDTLKNTAEAFLTSRDTVGNLKNDNHKNSLVKENKLSAIRRIREKTEAEIEKCVEFLTIAKEMGNKELLATAESLSRIHRNVGTSLEDSDNSKTQFIFYIPESQASVKDYEIVEAAT